MTVSFRCGHSMSLPDTVAAAPRCGICGETVVSRVTVRPPTFTGHCRGPHATYHPLEPIPVDLRPVKEKTHG